MRPFALKLHAARRAFPLGLAAILCASCAISQQQEVDLGASTAAQVSAQLPLVRDAGVVSYINTLGLQLAKVTDARSLAWHFTVVDSKEVNAFALPGGWVYVNRGLIERATDMSQLAGVLGHEIGHVTRRHSVQQLQQAQGANVGLTVLCTLTKVCNTGASQAAINLGASRFKSFYSVSLPLATPGIIASTLLVFLYSLDEFTGTLLVGSPFVLTLPVYMYRTSVGYELQVASISALMLMVPGIVLLVLLERYMKSEYLSMFGRI